MCLCIPQYKNKALQMLTSKESMDVKGGYFAPRLPFGSGIVSQVSIFVPDPTTKAAVKGTAQVAWMSRGKHFRQSERITNTLLHTA